MKRKVREVTNYRGWGKVVDPRSDDRMDDLGLPRGANGPNVIPRYGCKPFTPLTRCEDIHHGPIKSGSLDYCEVCGRAGCDHWPRLGIPKTGSSKVRGKRAYVRRKLRGGIGD